MPQSPLSPFELVFSVEDCQRSLTVLERWKGAKRFRPEEVTRIKRLIDDAGLSCVPTWGAAALIGVNPTRLEGYERAGRVRRTNSQFGTTFYGTAETRVRQAFIVSNHKSGRVSKNMLARTIDRQLREIFAKADGLPWSKDADETTSAAADDLLTAVRRETERWLALLPLYGFEATTGDLGVATRSHLEEVQARLMAKRQSRLR